MFHEIWVQDVFSRDSFYCPVRLPSTSSCDINPLWSSDAIWRQGSRWTLVQVMACCLRHQAITWTNVDLSSMRSLGIHLRALSLDTVKIPVNKTRSKIAVLKWQPGLPGANELIVWVKQFPIFRKWGFQVLATSQYWKTIEDTHAFYASSNNSAYKRLIPTGFTLIGYQGLCIIGYPFPNRL